jgi:fructose-1,6-bisphosphatase/sedoheptulose 1,7-bisphosphatase-like protein
MRSLILISAFAVFPSATHIVANTVGIPGVPEGILQAGGMGILGWLLYSHIKQSHETIKEVSEKHKEGLTQVATEINGLRKDISTHMDENNRVLMTAVGLSKYDKNMGS